MEVRAFQSVKEQARLAKARVGAYARRAGDRTLVAKELSDPATSRTLRRAVSPPDASKSLKKAGVLLLLTPDPITAIPGAALVGAGFIMKSREAMSIEALLRETKKTMRDLEGYL